MKIIARNKKAFHDYEIVEKVVAGISLTGFRGKIGSCGQADPCRQLCIMFERRNVH